MDFNNIQMEYIVRPLIGAAIGYVTNWIAVKMMFRPRKAYYIGKIKLPFTPGIIPKNKERIAIAIADTISNNLLSESDLRQTLLSDSMKTDLRNKLSSSLEELSSSDKTIKDIIISGINETNYNNIKTHLTENISEGIFEKVTDANLGKLIAAQIHLAVSEKLKGSVMGIFGGNALITGLTSAVEVKINSYIEENGLEYFSNMVNDEINKYTSYTLGDVSKQALQSKINIIDIILEAYEKLVIEQLPNLLNTLNISKIVTDKINSMDNVELERLILQIMKKELNALVNLGAIIGLVLGLLNLAI